MSYVLNSILYVKIKFKLFNKQYDQVIKEAIISRNEFVTNVLINHFQSEVKKNNGVTLDLSVNFELFFNKDNLSLLISLLNTGIFQLNKEEILIVIKKGYIDLFKAILDNNCFPSDLIFKGVLLSVLIKDIWLCKNKSDSLYPFVVEIINYYIKKNNDDWHKTSAFFYAILLDNKGILDLMLKANISVHHQLKTALSVKFNNDYLENFIVNIIKKNSNYINAEIMILIANKGLLKALDLLKNHKDIKLVQESNRLNSIRWFESNKEEIEKNIFDKDFKQITKNKRIDI